MSGIPFDDLLAELERDPKETALTLMEAIKVQECSMSDVLFALRDAASKSGNAENPIVAERLIAAIANGVRHTDPAAYDRWVAERGVVLRPGIETVLADMPDRTRSPSRLTSPQSNGQRTNRGETMGNAFRKVALSGGTAGACMIGILLLLGEDSIVGLSLMGVGTAFTVSYLAMYHFFGYSKLDRH